MYPILARSYKLLADDLKVNAPELSMEKYDDLMQYARMALGSVMAVPVQSTFDQKDETRRENIDELHRTWWCKHTAERCSVTHELRRDPKTVPQKEWTFARAMFVQALLVIETMWSAVKLAGLPAKLMGTDAMGSPVNDREEESFRDYADEAMPRAMEIVRLQAALEPMGPTLRGLTVGAIQITTEEAMYPNG